MGLLLLRKKKVLLKNVENRMNNCFLLRNVIVYFGMGFLPESNAVACRELAMAELIKKSGYVPILIGIENHIPFGEYKENECFGIRCYSIRYPRTMIERIYDTKVVHKAIIKILEHIGVNRIKCLIMQDYQLIPMVYLKRYSKKRGISFAVDVMDWFVPNRDYPVVKNILKATDTVFRMRFFYRFLKNRIFISHKFYNFFHKSDVKNDCVIPCTKRTLNQNYTAGKSDEKIITFAGFPGRHFEKEKLDWIVQALYENKSKMMLNIVGVSEKQFLNADSDLKRYLSNRIHFYGHIPHEECAEVLRNSDFSIIARKKTKLSEYGFSSKICEAMAYNIPVITTRVGDNSLYIQDGVNGFLCNPDYESLKALLCRVETLSPEQIQQMKKNISKVNVLAVSKFSSTFSEFLIRLQ